MNKKNNNNKKKKNSLRIFIRKNIYILAHAGLEPVRFALLARRSNQQS